MQKLMLKLTTAVMLVLASVTGSLTLQSVESASDTEIVATSALDSVSSSHAASAANSGTNATDVTDRAIESSTFIVGSPVDVITAGMCAALIGCCLLGLALLRLYRRADPGSSWTATLRRTSSSVSPPALVTSPIRPLLLLLSISRT